MDSSKQNATKVISIRLPVEELEQVDRDAKASGLSRSDYIRARLRSSAAFVETGKLVQLAEVLRQLQTAQSAYIFTLSRMLDLVEERGEDKRVAEIESIVKGEIARADELMELLFRAERRAVRILRLFQKAR